MIKKQLSIKKNPSDFQLVLVGLELVQKITAISECCPEIVTNPHMVKAIDCAIKWKELFFDAYITQQAKE